MIDKPPIREDVVSRENKFTQVWTLWLLKLVDAMNGPAKGTELSADPADPAEGSYVIWMSDGTGAGDDGDIMVKITAGGVTKTGTLVDYSTL